MDELVIMICEHSNCVKSERCIFSDQEVADMANEDKKIFCLKWINLYQTCNVRWIIRMIPGLCRGIF